MKIMSVVGARPQFVKLAPIDHACRQRGVEHIIVHTGQHYDPLLSQVFFDDLDISQPDVHLGVGSSTHGRQTGAMLAAMDQVLEDYRPDWVLVYGDTNSTIAAALCAVKAHIPVAHLEAGLRSFNREMPEEINRVLTDHCADLLLAPTKVAAQHLSHEGLSERTVVVGDVMTDVLLATVASLPERAPELLTKLNLHDKSYFLATIHRPANTDSADNLREIMKAFSQLPHPVVFLAHPRVVAKAEELGVKLAGNNIILHAPLPYPQLMHAAKYSAGIITDSGGLQKEAFLLQIPCTTVRPETEWVETLVGNWNVLVPPSSQIVQAATRPHPLPSNEVPYGNGTAAQTVIDTLESTQRR